VCQNLVSLVNIKIAGKWMFIPLKMVLIGIDPYPYKMEARKNDRFPGSKSIFQIQLHSAAFVSIPTIRLGTSQDASVLYVLV